MRKKTRGGSILKKVKNVRNKVEITILRKEKKKSKYNVVDLLRNAMQVKL